MSIYSKIGAPELNDPLLSQWAKDSIGYKAPAYGFSKYGITDNQRPADPRETLGAQFSQYGTDPQTVKQLVEGMAQEQERRRQDNGPLGFLTKPEFAIPAIVSAGIMLGNPGLLSGMGASGGATAGQGPLGLPGMNTASSSLGFGGVQGVTATGSLPFAQGLTAAPFIQGGQYGSWLAPNAPSAIGSNPLSTLKNVGRGANAVNRLAGLLSPDQPVDYTPTALPQNNNYSYSPFSLPPWIDNFSGGWDAGIPYQLQSELLSRDMKAPTNYYANTDSPYFSLL